MIQNIRLDRKNNNFELVNKGGMLDLFDNVIKEVFRINDKQYDYLLEVMTEQEQKLFIKEDLSFTEKRQVLIILQNHLKNYTE